LSGVGWRWSVEVVVLFIDDGVVVLGAFFGCPGVLGWW